MTYLITGGTGQLGTELTELLKSKNIPAVSFSSEEMNILDKEQVKELMMKVKPTVVFHCAAFTAVDKAEDEQKELNWEVNVEGTKNVAEICKELNCTFIYISTDYVFDGETDSEYTEESAVNPINEYGKAKLAGEELVRQLLEKHYIIRTSWVFGEYGSNFVYTMKRLAQTNKVLTIVNDQVGRPTWTRTLAEFMIHLIRTKQEYGTYHLSNDGSCSWYEFAKEILKDEPVEVKPISSKEFPQKARRPKTSIMSLDKTKKTGFIITHWNDALHDFLNS